MTRVSIVVVIVVDDSAARKGPVAGAAGTPVVSLFAPTIAFGRWGPYRTPVLRLGDQLGRLIP